MPGTRLKSIGDYAFCDCGELSSITLNEGLKSIGSCAFYNCEKLDIVTIPESVSIIGEYAFYKCNSLKSIVIPDKVKIINEGAFDRCSKLAAVTIPDSVTSIGRVAFLNCGSLTQITIPDSVTNIGDSAFKGCSNLKTVDIPNSVESLNNYVFSECSNLVSVKISNSLKSIPQSTFYGFSSLTSVEIPDGVTSIGNSAFNGCTSLAEVKLSESVESISANAFFGCISLESVAIPESVSSIGENAFNSCTSLETVIIPNKDCTIYDSANTITGNAVVIYGYSGSTAETYANKYGKNFTALDKIAAPQKLTASVVDERSVLLSWKRYNGVHGYNIYCSDSQDGEYKKIGSTTKTTYTDAKPLYTHPYYKVTAFISAGDKEYEGALSEAVSCKLNALSPDAPTDIKAEADGYTSIKLSWTAADGADGCNIYRSETKDGEYTKIKTTDETAFTDTGLESGKTYYYKLSSFVTVDGNELEGELSEATECGLEPEVIVGDINGDRTVDTKDLTRFMKYLSGEEVEVNEEALDTNGDKTVDIRDLVRLMKILSEDADA